MIIIDEHNLLIQSVSCDDWEVIYVNNNIVDQGHSINPYTLFTWIKHYIHKVTYITSFNYESYWVSDEFIESGIPKHFTDIPEDEFL